MLVFKIDTLLVTVPKTLIVWKEIYNIYLEILKYYEARIKIIFGPFLVLEKL